MSELQDINADPAADALRRKRLVQRLGFITVLGAGLGIGAWWWSQQPDARRGFEVRGLGVGIAYADYGEQAQRVGDSLVRIGFRAEMIGPGPPEQTVASAAKAGLEYVAVLEPDDADLGALEKQVGPLEAPDGARWLVLDLDELDAASASATWGPTPPSRLRGYTPDVLDALLRQSGLQPRPSERGNSEIAGFNATIGDARAWLEDSRRVDARAEALAASLNDVEGLQARVGPGGTLALPPSTTGTAIAIDPTSWVALCQSLEVTHDGVAVNVARSGSLALHHGGFDRPWIRVTDPHGKPFDATVGSELRQGSSGTVFFVRAPSGARRVFYVEPSGGTGASVVRMGARIEAPTKIEPESYATNGAGMLASVVDDGFASWVRLLLPDHSVHDLAPIPNEALGAVHWLDEETIIASGRIHDGDRPDQLWVFDARVADPDATEALEPRAPRPLASRHFGRAATRSRLDGVVVVSSTQLVMDRHHTHGTDTLRVELRGKGDELGMGRVAVVPDAARTGGLRRTGDGARICQWGSQSIRCVDAGATYPFELSEHVGLPRGSVATMSRGGELVVANVEREVDGQTLALASAWRTGNSAAPEAGR